MNYDMNHRYMRVERDSKNTTSIRTTSNARVSNGARKTGGGKDAGRRNRTRITVTAAEG